MAWDWLIGGNKDKDKEEQKRLEQERLKKEAEFELAMVEKMLREIDGIGNAHAYKELLVNGASMGCEHSIKLSYLSKQNMRTATVGFDDVLMTTCLTGPFGVCRSPHLTESQKKNTVKITIPKTDVIFGGLEHVTESGPKCIMKLSQTWGALEEELLISDWNTGEELKVPTTQSYLVCYYGRGCVFPVSSGQRTVTTVVDEAEEKVSEGSGQIADKYYASERLKIRATPNGQQIDGNRVFTSGAIVKIHESKETQKVDGSDSTWIKIYYDVNKIGWVGKEYLEELPQPVAGYNFKYNWDKSQYVSQDFKDKTAGVAKSLGVDPDDLMAIMAFESYFNPAQKNMGGGSATGLVQFMPDTAQDLHTTTTELAAMTGVEQLDYVYGYFYPYKGRLVTLSDIYMRVLWPAGIGKGEDETIFTKGDGRYEANSGLDINLDNKITKKEATQKVIDERSKY